jgi:hypothetical protein
MAEEIKFDLKSGLNAWVEKNSSIRQFAETLGYQYANAWTILRGKQPVTVETVGRFALAYGPGALSEMLALAGLADNHEVKFQNGIPVAVAVEKSGELSYEDPVEVA